MISEKLDLAVDDLAAELVVIADPVLEGDPSRPPPEGDDFLGGATGVEVTFGGEGLLLPKPVLDPLNRTPHLLEVDCCIFVSGFEHLLELHCSHRYVNKWTNFPIHSNHHRLELLRTCLAAPKV